MTSFIRVMVVTVGFFSLPVIAHGDDDVDYKIVRDLRKSGKIVAVEALLADARRRRTGTLLEVELKVKKGRYLYEIEILGDEGVVFEYYYEAQTGHFIKEEIHDE